MNDLVSQIINKSVGANLSTTNMNINKYTKRRRNIIISILRPRNKKGNLLFGTE